jgi:carbamoyltransferase
MVKRDIIVLGINDGHDAGAALIKNGEIIAAVQEERLNNIKHFDGVPEKSILEVFNTSNIDPTAVNLIALAGYEPLVWGDVKTLKSKFMVKMSPFLHSSLGLELYINQIKKRRTFKKFKLIFKKLGLLHTEACVIEHHTAHAAVAYRNSPWVHSNNNMHDDVLILTTDGQGDGLSSTVNIGNRGNISRVAFSSYYDSVANVFYSEITRYLGLRPGDHESKVMGLAPYGNSEYCIDEMRKIIRIDPHNPLRFQNTIGALTYFIQPKLRKLLVNQRFDNIAAAAQRHLEDLMKKWVEHSIQSTAITKLACAGGLFLNVKVNKMIREMKQVDAVFYYPAPGDEGIPVGAALQGYYEYCVREGITPKQVPIGQTYYGPSFSNDSVKQILINNSNTGNYKYDFYGDIDGIVGELLVKGKTIARCTGGAEWGPRALGNRSIMANPHDMRTIHKINFAIKQRDFWMPFAPSLLEERKDDYLVDPEFAPYMIMAFDSTEEAKDKIPATLHPYDGTCRPQTVRSEWNPSYYKIIKIFESATGIGAILNTSFNLHGYPMVGTPQTALWTLANSKLDGLAIGNYLVTKQ